MKNFRKALALVLCAVMALSCLLLPASAKTALPQSDHPYADNEEKEYTYTYSGSGNGFFMTFSDDTYFEPVSVAVTAKDGTTEYYSVDAINEMSDADFAVLYYTAESIDIKYGDSLMIESEDHYIGLYDGNELAGKTVYIPGDKVTMTLSSDESVTGYGFRVTSVSDKAPAGCLTVSYMLADGKPGFIDCVEPGGTTNIIPNYDLLYGQKAYIGWAEKKNGPVVYDGDEEITVTKSFTLYPVLTDILLAPEEVFAFDNDYEPFAVDTDGEELTEEELARMTYYMGEDDYSRMVENLSRTGIISPFTAASYPFSAWGGSCYGMSLTVALQHYGLLDMLAYQDGAKNVRALTASPELISCINYYQAQELPARMMQNAADYPGTVWYTNQVKKMVETVKNGEIVLFGFYENHSYDSMGHAILLTGAYDDTQGNHILVAYDCNFGKDYSDGQCTRIIVSPDYSEMYSEMYGPLVGFDWLSDYSGFESFDINGGGDMSNWYKSIFANIKRFFDMIKEFFRTLFGLNR